MVSKTKAIPLEKREIVYLHHSGKTICEISRILNVSFCKPFIIFLKKTGDVANEDQGDQES